MAHLCHLFRSPTPLKSSLHGKKSLLRCLPTDTFESTDVKLKKISFMMDMVHSLALFNSMCHQGAYITPKYFVHVIIATGNMHEQNHLFSDKLGKIWG